MSETEELITETMFRLGDIKAKARTYEEAEKADAFLNDLRLRWAKYCKERVISREFKQAA